MIGFLFMRYAQIEGLDVITESMPWGGHGILSRAPLLRSRIVRMHAIAWVGCIFVVGSINEAVGVISVKVLTPWLILMRYEIKRYGRPLPLGAYYMDSVLSMGSLCGLRWNTRVKD